MTTTIDLMAGFDWLGFLVESATKATAVLVLTAVAAILLRRSSSAVRHLVWFVGIAGLLALLPFSALLPSWQLAVLPSSDASTIVVAETSPSRLAGIAESTPPRVATIPSIAVHAEPGAPNLWLARLAVSLAGLGVLVGLAWLASGFWGAARLARRAEEVRDGDWLDLAEEVADELGLRRSVLLLRSDEAIMPATSGLLRSSLVLPSTANAWPADRRRAVLAHELAHVKRYDCLTQALAQMACVLLWWHPAVWYAARRLRVERERACDDLVLGAGARASEYAMHLLEIARAHRAPRLAAPALVSMAKPSQLESRLLWILDGSRARTAPSTRATMVALVLGMIVVAPVSAMRVTEASGVVTDPAISVQREGRLLDSEGRSASGTGSAEPGRLRVSVRELIDAIVGQQVPVAGQDEAPSNISIDQLIEARAVGVDTPYIGSLLAAGVTDLTIDELIEMRSIGVTARYVAELEAVGLSGLTADELVGLRATGVTARYAAEMKAAGLGPVGVDDLIGLRSVGVTLGYVTDLTRHGLSDLSVDDVTSLKAMGVDGQYVTAMAEAGLGSLNAEELASMRATGVTAEYIAAMNRAGLGTLSADDLVSMRAMGITPEFIAGMNQAGLGRLSADDLVSLRALGATPASIAELRAAGVTEIDEDLIAMGVTAAYVRQLAEVGLSGLSAEDLTDLKAVGITPALVRQLVEAGLGQLTTNQLVRLRASGLDRDLIESRR